MNKLMTVAKRFHHDEDGAAMVEYSILLGLIAAATLTIIAFVASWVSDQFTGLCANLDGKGVTSAGAAGGNCGAAG